MINKYIAALAEYAVNTELIEEADRIYSVNMLLDVLKLDEYSCPDDKAEIENLSKDLEGILKFINDNGELPNYVEIAGYKVPKKVYQKLFNIN